LIDIEMFVDGVRILLNLVEVGCFRSYKIVYIVVGALPHRAISF